MNNTLTITVKRPTGIVEVIDISKKFTGGYLPRHYYDQMVRDTRAAGRGEIIACSNIGMPTIPENEYRPTSRMSEIERAGDINRYERDGA